MIHLALLSEGPSVHETYRAREGYDAVVGVNGIPTIWPCDWWAFVDPQFYVFYGPSILGHPRIFTKANLFTAMRDGWLVAEGLEEGWAADQAEDRIVWEHKVAADFPPVPEGTPVFPGGPRKGLPQIGFSGCVALVCCWYIAGEAEATIDVYGVDLRGVSDAHGTPPPFGQNLRDRSEGRWAKERRLWDGLVQALRDTGRFEIRWTPPEER